MKRINLIAAILCFSMLISSCSFEKQSKTDAEEKNPTKTKEVVTDSENATQNSNSPVEIYDNDTPNSNEPKKPDEALTSYENGADVSQYIAVRMDELNKKWDPKNQESEIAKFNNTRGNSHLSDETIKLLLNCITLSERTDGLLDITMYPLTRMWGFESDEPKKPDQMLVSLVISKCGMDTISVSNNMFTVGTYTMLDASAVTAGFAADLISSELSEKGYDHALISIGEHTRTLGTKPDQTKWSVQLRNPFQTDQSYATLSIEGNLSVSTKGSYQHYYEEDGKRYCNIFDPKTGMPVDNDLVAVTVVYSDGMTADAYATACFILGSDGAKQFYKEKGGFELILVFENGEIQVSEGLSASLKLSDENQKVAVFK